MQKGDIYKDDDMTATFIQKGLNQNEQKSNSDFNAPPHPPLISLRMFFTCCFHKGSEVP